MKVGGYRPFSSASPREVEEGFPDEIMAFSGVLAQSGKAYNDSIVFHSDSSFVQLNDEVSEKYKATTNPDFNPVV